jgi:predicted flap endonuclease-1-like 5' DNA nuclease
MKNDHIRMYWLGFIVALVGISWLLWLWRRQREVTPKPLYISQRMTAYPMPTKTAQPKKQPPDDLTTIQGIGPATARRLNEAGITTFAQVAEADPASLREITGVTRWDPAQWIVQAKERAAGVR